MKKQTKILAIAFSALGLMITALVVFIFLSLIFFVKPVQIKGHSMEPNYQDGERYLIKLWDKKFQRGDVVVYKNPENESQLLIQRIIAIPDDKFMIKSGQFWLNGQKLEENYVKGETFISQNEEYFIDEEVKYTVTENSYFVLGDNRGNSLDSRSLGFIPEKNITGKVWLKY